MITYIYVMLICVGGSLIQGLSGFGFAMFVMFFLPFIMPLKAAAVVTGVQTLFMGAYVLTKFKKHIDYKLAIVPLICSLVFVPIGVYILVFGDENILKKVLGFTIIIISIFLFINSKKEIKVKTNINNGIISGSLSGIMSGMFNVGGPPLVVYYLYGAKDKMSYKATLEFSFLLRSLLIVITHFIYGNIDLSIMKLSLSGIIGTLIGTMIGLKIFRKINNKNLNVSVNILMLVLGLLLILNL